MSFNAHLKQQAFERETLGEVSTLVQTIMEQRRANSMRPITEDQMRSHCLITDAAAKFVFVRESDLFTSYLSCLAGQRIENARWDHKTQSTDNNLWQSLAQTLLAFGRCAAKKFHLTLGLLLMVAAVLYKLQNGASTQSNDTDTRTLDSPKTTTHGAHLLAGLPTAMSTVTNPMTNLLDPPATRTHDIETDIPSPIFTAALTVSNPSTDLLDSPTTSTHDSETKLQGPPITTTLTISGPQANFGHLIPDNDDWLELERQTEAAQDLERCMYGC